MCIRFNETDVTLVHNMHVPGPHTDKRTDVWSRTSCIYTQIFSPKEVFFHVFGVKKKIQKKPSMFSAIYGCTGTWLENPKHPYLPILIHRNTSWIWRLDPGWHCSAVRIDRTESVKFWLALWLLALHALPSHPELKYLFNNNVTVNYSTLKQTKLWR